MFLRPMTKIITHSGFAHLDDFLSTCLILYKDKSVDEIRRQSKVADGELTDSNIWKIDISENHDPNIRAFDHHQEEMSDCAFSLLLKFWGIWEEAIEVYPWIPSMVEIDTQGLEGVLLKNRIPNESFFLLKSFVEHSFIEMFQRSTIISKKRNKLLFVILKLIGKQFFTGIEVFKQVKNRFESLLNVVSINKDEVEEDFSKGILVLFYLTKKPEYSSHLRSIIQEYKNKHFPQYSGSWVSAITYDRPENSIYLKRHGKTSQIDFSRIKSLERTYFAHNKGFMAIVERMDEEELKTYVRHALR